MKNSPKVIPLNRTSSDKPACYTSSEQLPAATPEHSEGNQDVVNALVLAKVNRITDQPRIDAAVKQAIADRMRDDPLASYSDIGEQLGVSKDFVAKIAAKINSGDNDLADRRLRAFQRQIGKELPMRDRVMIYGTIARGEANPKAAFSQAAVLKRIEELEGIVTAKEKRESADNQQMPKLPAMFVLPGDTTIDVGIRIRTGKQRS